MLRSSRVVPVLALLVGVLVAMGVVNLLAGGVFIALGWLRPAGTPLPAPATTASAFAEPSGHVAGYAAFAAIALLTGFAMMTLQSVLIRLGGLAFGACSVEAPDEPSGTAGTGVGTAGTPAGGSGGAAVQAGSANTAGTSTVTAGTSAGGMSGGTHIDYVMFGPGVTAKSADIIFDHEGDIYPSDHYPLSAVLTLPAQ